MRPKQPIIVLLLVKIIHITVVSTSNSLPFIHSQADLNGGGFFFDEYGRHRIFHGSNRVWKSAPWFFSDMLNPDQREFKLMKKMGFNVMRLGYMWSGYNPEPNVFNQTYVDIIKLIVKGMADHGVYTLLDMHEDVLSSKFCLYDGAPKWVIDKSQPKHAFPWPLKGNCSSRGWMMNTLTEAAATAYQDIYDNNYGMLDDLSAFWERSAQQFKDIPSVIGYEIMNEPFAGNVFEDPLLFLPGVAGAKNLQRMHDTVAKAIRKFDNRHIIFFEPVTWGMIFNGKIAGSGYDHVPGGELYQNRSAFSYHYYCSTFDDNYNNQPLIRRVICDDTVGPLVFEAVRKDLQKFGGSAMMTEGLACDQSAPGEKGKNNECDVVMRALDKNLFSWTDYGDSQGATWNPSKEQQAKWARSYAQAIAGTPINMTFSPQTKNFEFCFSLDLAIDMPTEIFASLTYSYNVTRRISTSPNIKVKDDETDIVYIIPTRSATQGSTACVRITR